MGGGRGGGLGRLKPPPPPDFGQNISIEGLFIHTIVE